MTDATHFIVLPHVSVIGANAISSPITHGFPSITAFAGLMWAMQRKLGRTQLSDISLLGVGVVCHRHSEQALPYWAGNGTGMVRSFTQSRNPLNAKGEISPIIEEGRTNLELSLVFEVSCPRWLPMPLISIVQELRTMRALLMTMRAAGGVMFERPGAPASRSEPWAVPCASDRESNEETFSDLRFALSPGFALVSRHQLFLDNLAKIRSQDEEASAFDVLLASCRREWSYCSETGKWFQSGADVREGWIEPIPVGFASLGRASEPGRLEGVRDPSLRHFFVESVYSLGEWIPPYKISSIEDLIWRPRSEGGRLFDCKNSYEASFKN
ncbi:type I-F CRISPR-associated protein Csy2 [Acetobacter persici]|uniref:type I-F CRISPR-associated protein Csy2 n=1 Tax=Acetobacter persici TaxID=1076596 RepID=UPI0012FE231C|nr:type I-F CRISPR-associated protein Csy2 [Acetobacter persici]